jgi:hypothetical protein
LDPLAWGSCLPFYSGQGPPSPHRLGEEVATSTPNRRRGIAAPLQLSVNVIHGAEKHRSTGVVEELLMSSPGALHHPPQSLRGSSNRHTTLCRCVRGCRFQSRRHGRRALLATIFASFLVLSFSKAKQCTGRSGLSLFPHEEHLLRGSLCIHRLSVVLLVRRLLTRVFFIGLEWDSRSLMKKMGRLSGRRAGGLGYPSIQYTDSNPWEPGPLTHPLEGAKGQGPLEVTGPANSMRQHTRSRGHVEMQ